MRSSFLAAPSIIFAFLITMRATIVGRCVLRPAVVHQPQRRVRSDVRTDRGDRRVDSDKLSPANRLPLLTRPDAPRNVQRGDTRYAPHRKRRPPGARQALPSPGGYPRYFQFGGLP